MVSAGADPPGNPRMRPAMAHLQTQFDPTCGPDYLGFWVKQTLQARKVAKFLDLDKRTIAKFRRFPALR
jgi:hypothetical protein